MSSLTVDNEVLSLALSCCAKVSLKDKDMPNLAAVYLSTDGGRLHLRTSDGPAKEGHSFLHVSLPCKGELAQPRAVNIGRLTDLVSTAGKREGKKAPLVSLGLADGGLKLGVTVAGRDFELGALENAEVTEPPVLPPDATRCHYPLPAELRAALDYAMPAAASPAQEQAALVGVVFLEDMVAASDGVRIHSTTGFPNLAQPRGATLGVVASKALAGALKLVQPAEVVGQYDDGQHVFQFDFRGRGGIEVQLINITLGLEVPNLEKLVAPPPGAFATISLPSAALFGALTMALHASPNRPAVLFADNEEGTLLVRATDEDGTTCSETLKAVVTSPAKQLRVQVNPRQVMSALTASGPQVTLRVEMEEDVPFRVTGEHPGRLALICRMKDDGVSTHGPDEAAPAPAPKKKRGKGAGGDEKGSEPLA